MEVVPALRLVEKPTVNASGSPPTLREGEREEEVNFTARENYPGFPTWGRPLDVGEAGGNPGHLPGNPFAKGGSPARRTLVTMTIQLQPPVAIAAAYPIRLVSFPLLPGLHLIPSKSPCVQREGPQKGGGVLSVTVGREGRQESRE